MRVAVLTWGSRGDYQPYVALAKAFHRAGHDVRLGGPPGPNNAQLAAAHGIDFVPLGPGVGEPYIDSAYRGVGLTNFNPVALVRTTLDHLLTSPAAEHMLAECLALARWSDVVVAHFLQVAGRMSAEMTGRPFVSGTLVPTQLATETRPPGTRTNLGHFRNRRLWSEARKQMNAAWSGPINDARVRFGLAPLKDLTQDGLYSCALNLVAVSPSVYPRPPDWAPQHQMTGYWMLGVPDDWHPPQSLEAFIGQGEPPVAVDFGSMTSTHTDAFSGTVIEAIRLAGTRAIVDGGGKMPASSESSDIFVSRDIPHAWLLPKAACLVHHGGAGTAASSWHAGIPSVIVPHVYDQHFWADLSNKLGVAGRPIPLRKLTSDRLAQAIRRTMRDRSLKERAGSLARTLGRADGAGAAVRLVEEYVAAVRPPPNSVRSVTPTPAAVPSTTRQATSDWFSRVLSDAGVLRCGRVSSITIEPIGEGQGFVGRAYRVSLSYRDVDPCGLPRTLILKLPTDDDAQRRVFLESRLYEREVRFYQELRSATPLPTPRCYFAGCDAEAGRFALVLEDLEPAKPGDPLQGCSADRVRNALDLIRRLHVRWWEEESLERIDWIPPVNNLRIMNTIAQVYEPAWAAFARRAEGHLPKNVLRIGFGLGGVLPDVLNALARPPRTLVHGDYQLGNVFYTTNGEIAAVTDWQVTVKARGAMDIAHFIVRALSSEERRLTERSLVKYYHAGLSRDGVKDYSLRECWHDYRLAVLSQFGLGVVLSYGLGGTNGLRGADQQRSNLAAVVGGRLIAALNELDFDDIVPPQSKWRRLLSASSVGS